MKKALCSLKVVGQAFGVVFGFAGAMVAAGYVVIKIMDAWQGLIRSLAIVEKYSFGEFAMCMTLPLSVCAIFLAVACIRSGVCCKKPEVKAKKSKKK